MNILVVGGAGFIGHTVVRILNRLGHNVSIMDSMTTYGVVKRPILDSLINERMALCTANITINDINSIANVLHVISSQQPEVIIHLANFPRAKIVNSAPTVASKTMIIGIENLLEASSLCSNVTRFVYISSSMVYGDFESGVGENASLKSQNIYATYKIACEQLTKYYANRYETFDYTIIRPSAVYGPRDVEDRVVSKFFKQAYNNDNLNINGITEKLDFSYVDDTAYGIVQAALHPIGANETFNISRGVEHTIHDAACIIRDIVGKGNICIRDKNPLMPSRGYLDINKARALLGFNPTINIEEGFEKYYEWMQSSFLRD